MNLTLTGVARSRKLPSLALLLVISGAAGALVISAAFVLISVGIARANSPDAVGVFPSWFVALLIVIISFFSGLISGGFSAVGWLIARRLFQRSIWRVLVVAIFGAIGGELCYFVALGGTVGAWEGYLIAAGLPAVAFGVVTLVWLAQRVRLPVKGNLKG